ncbi:MAG: IS66 family insertion sequence element accessory protein TnpB [Chlamydiae bacterium]|jgi:transposase|nr:IS66 family insertion sequence element accessory protein TnpB [Chlamydiota bacterium]MBM3197800.1 IS66 family insertion sequence element accessory protein TnpB [Chlamydiota bacterium]
MLGLSGESKIFVCLEAVDLRKGFEGLSRITESLFPQKLLTGSYFVFLNKGRSTIKVLYWDTDGLAIWNKRLERGSFPKDLLQKQMDRRSFLMLLEGVVPRKICRRFSSF